MSTLRQIQVPYDAGCLHCGQAFTDSLPPTRDVPMRNPERGVEVLISMHERCARECDAGYGQDGLLVRLEHFLDHHAELGS